MLTGALEQVHAELLGAEPAAAPSVQHGQGVARQVRKVPTQERRIGDDVRSGRLILEAGGGRGLVVARRVAVDAGRADAAGRRFLRALDEHRHLLRIGRGEEIAAPVQQESVVALVRQLFEQIDAPVHECDHVVAGSRPPVAVALGGFVAGERERRALVDEHDAGDAPAHRQVIRGGDPGDAGAADDDFRGGRAHAR